VKLLDVKDVVFYYKQYNHFDYKHLKFLHQESPGKVIGDLTLVNTFPCEIFHCSIYSVHHAQL